MPFALDPNETAPFTLASDRGKPGAPVFLFHYLTCRELRRVQQLRQEARAISDNTASMAKVDEAILIGLVGWENVTDRKGNPIPFAPDRLDDVLSTSDKWEMVFEYPSVLTASEMDRKKSLWQSASDAALCAEDAAPAATIDPPATNPSSLPATPAREPAGPTAPAATEPHPS